MTRADNRAAFPGIADIIDQVRVHFPHAKLLHGEEGGREIGKPIDGFWIDTLRVDEIKAAHVASNARGNGKGWGIR